MFGSHLSIAGGWHKAALAAEALGLETVQIFTKNQQQWVAPPPKIEAVAVWRAQIDRLGWAGRVVAHASYLINLAAPEGPTRQKSLDAFADEIARCAILGVPYLVIHPGAHLSDGESAGIGRVVQAIDTTFDRSDTPGGMTVCLESTAGQGSCLGHRLEHLADILATSRHAHRLAVCLDTAHLFAAGYDFRGERYDAFAEEIARTIGTQRVRVWHLNDSKKPFGSRVDRHEHVGLGTIGDDGFAPILRDERWRNVPKILETPKATAPDGQPWDVINLRRLRDLAEDARLHVST